MSEAEFYFECEVCKEKMPATYANPRLPKGQEVKKDFGAKIEITFRCPTHKVDTEGS